MNYQNFSDEELLRVVSAEHSIHPLTVELGRRLESALDLDRELVDDGEALNEQFPALADRLARLARTAKRTKRDGGLLFDELTQLSTEAAELAEAFALNFNDDGSYRE